MKKSNYDGPGLAAILLALLQSTVPGIWTVVYDSANVAMSISFCVMLGSGL
jgi:hypothetical protein